MNLLLENSFRSVGSLRGQHEVPARLTPRCPGAGLLRACAFVTKKEPARAAEGPLKPWVLETSWGSRRPPGATLLLPRALDAPCFVAPVVVSMMVSLSWRLLCNWHSVPLGLG